MIKTFVDTAAWIGLLNEDDALHVRALAVLVDLRRRNVPLLTTEFVLIELADALCSAANRAKTVIFVNRLRLEPNIEILPASSEMLDNGWRLYSERSDKNWSLTDCISFAVMQGQSIVQVFTSDHHFEQAGFQKLM